jgi:hypothetical protein
VENQQFRPVWNVTGCSKSASGSSGGNSVEVQVLSSAPNKSIT